MGSESRSRPTITSASDSGAVRSTPASTGSDSLMACRSPAQTMSNRRGGWERWRHKHTDAPSAIRLRDIHQVGGWRRPAGGVRLRWMTAVLAPIHPDSRGRSDYAIVKRRVRDAGLLEKQPWFYARSIAAKLSLLAACLVVFALFRDPWVQAANAVVLAFVSGQLGFQLHDSGHRQMFTKGWLNALVGLITGNLLLGMSYGWWVDKHNRHHANPNHVDLDPDINMVAIAYSQSQAAERRGLLRTMARHQAYLFFPLLLLLGWSMHVSSLNF